MHTFLGLFDPGWRDFAVRNANTEITILWILAALVGALLYHLFIGRKKKIPVEWENRYQAVEKDLAEERARHHKMKMQLEAAVAKANSFSSASHELDKMKTKLHDIQKEWDHSKGDAEKIKAELMAEHAKVTSLMVDQGEVEELRNRIRNQEKELQSHKGDAEKLKSELERTISEKTRLASSLEESKVNEIKGKLTRLENDLHSSRMLVAKYQSEAKVVEDERKRLMEESKALEEQKGESGNLKEKLASTEKDLQKARTGLAELTHLRAQVEELKKDKDNWENEANTQAKLAAESVNLRHTIETLQKEIGDLKANKAEAGIEHDELMKLKAEAGQLRSHLSMLESDLVNARQAYKELEEQYDALQKTEPAESSDSTETGNGQKTEVIPSPKDDLQKIEGIGPMIEELFFKEGIFTYEQMSTTPADKLHAILEAAGENFRIHDPGTWPEQAKLLVEGKLEEFDKLTKELKGGRKVD